jgi:hypothetical protein
MNSLIKIRNSAFILAIGALTLASCNDDDESDDPAPTPTTNVVKSGVLTADETWTAANIYELAGRVVVSEGVTLTIAPGTIIKGREGQGSLASALVVARGGRILAEGTATNPIIFTSTLDNIAVGQKVGTNLTREDSKKWGGVIVLGRAPISAENGDTETNIEGLPAEEGYGFYGGTVSNDDSGILSYVSIRHGGIVIGEGNEINGLTLGGVGTETVVNNIEVYATVDDGIECFGGTVDITNALVYYQGDDGIDLDMNYSGTIENFAVISGDGIGTDKSLEIDGPEGSTYVDGLFTLRNGICRLEGADGNPSDFKSKAQGLVENVTFESSKNLRVRASYQSDCVTARDDAFRYLTNGTDRFAINESEFAGITVYTSSNNGQDPPVPCTVPAEDQAAAESAVNGNGAGATIDLNALFGSWTCAGLRGQL